MIGYQTCCNALIGVLAHNTWERSLLGITQVMFLLACLLFSQNLNAGSFKNHFAIGAKAESEVSEFYSLWNSRHLTKGGNGFYSATRSDSFSEVMSIDAVADSFRGPLEPGSVAVTHNSWEAGIVMDGWRIGRMLRYDYVLKFSEDTAFLNYQLEIGGSASLDFDYSYDLFLQADHIRSNGFVIGKVLPVMIFKRGLLDIELAWMKSKQYYDGYMRGRFERGNLTENSLDEFEADFDFDALEGLNQPSQLVAEGERLQVTVAEIRELIESSNLWIETDYSYYRPGLREDEIDELEELRNLDSKGQGFSLSFELFMPVNERWSLQFAARDLLSAIRWRNTGVTSGNFYLTEGSSRVLDVLDHLLAEDVIKRFSGDDFQPLNRDDPGDPIAILPELGEEIRAEYANIEAYRGKYTQRLPRQFQLASIYEINRYITSEVIYRKNKVSDFWNLGFWFLGHLYLGVEPETNSYQVGVRHRYGSLRLMSDDSDVELAKRLTLDASVNLVF